MRIDSLAIHNFKNLRDLTIDFDEDSLSTVLIGRNGTGKSNLLEALVVLFRDLDLGIGPSFSYLIRYVCRGRTVEIDADPERSTGRTRVTVDGQPVRLKQLANGSGRFLPQYVFGYYSGPSNRFEEHFERHQARFYRELIARTPKDRGLPLRPLFYARPIHSQFVLLSYFLAQDENIRQFLTEYLNITHLESVLFIMKTPSWGRSSVEDRFWGARGVVRDFLDRLYDLSLGPVRLPFGRGERLYLYLKDVDALRELFAGYETQRDFFKALESTYISDLIDEVRIRVGIQGMAQPLTFAELSEGEQQLLVVLGLLRFTREEESLFLLDEPDTHLNPAWSVEYLRLLSDVVGENNSSHVLVATHNPLTISGLLKSQVQVFYRDDASGRIEVKMPDEHPRGMGVGALLTSELFGLRSTVDLDTLEKLDRKRELAAKESLTTDERSELEQLSEALGNLDFTQSVRDPLYAPFVRAMTAAKEYGPLAKPVLTPQEQQSQRQLARRILEDLKDRQDR